MSIFTASGNDSSGKLLEDGLASLSASSSMGYRIPALSLSSISTQGEDSDVSRNKSEFCAPKDFDGIKSLPCHLRDGKFHNKIHTNNIYHDETKTNDCGFPKPSYSTSFDKSYNVDQEVSFNNNFFNRDSHQLGLYDESEKIDFMNVLPKSCNKARTNTKYSDESDSFCNFPNEKSLYLPQDSSSNSNVIPTSWNTPSYRRWSLHNVDNLNKNLTSKLDLQDRRNEDNVNNLDNKSMTFSEITQDYRSRALSLDHLKNEGQIQEKNISSYTSKSGYNYVVNQPVENKRNCDQQDNTISNGPPSLQPYQIERVQNVQTQVSNQAGFVFNRTSGMYAGFDDLPSQKHEQLQNESLKNERAFRATPNKDGYTINSENQRNNFLEYFHTGNYPIQKDVHSASNGAANNHTFMNKTASFTTSPKMVSNGHIWKEDLNRQSIKSSPLMEHYSQGHSSHDSSFQPFERNGNGHYNTLDNGINGVDGHYLNNQEDARTSSDVEKNNLFFSNTKLCDYKGYMEIPNGTTSSHLSHKIHESRDKSSSTNQVFDNYGQNSFTSLGNENLEDQRILENASSKSNVFLFPISQLGLKSLKSNIQHHQLDYNQNEKCGQENAISSKLPQCIEQIPKTSRDRFLSSRKMSVDSSVSACLDFVSNVPTRMLYDVKFKMTQRTFTLGEDVKHDLKIGCYVKVEADRGEDLGILINATPADTLNYTGKSSGKNGSRLSRNSSTLDISPNNSPMKKSGLSGQNSIASELKKIIRLASQEEIMLLSSKRDEEDELLKICRNKVKQRGLSMNVVDAEYQFDRNKLTFFFEAEGRVDFRELVRDLFGIYKTRIWMQQLDKHNTNNSGSNVRRCNGNGKTEI